MTVHHVVRTLSCAAALLTAAAAIPSALQPRAQVKALVGECVTMMSHAVDEYGVISRGGNMKWSANPVEP